MYLCSHPDDIDGKGQLDIAVWGTMNNDTETNCLYAILQTSGQFNPQSLIITPTTTQPFLFETNYIRNIKTNCLILYNTSANTRSILYYTDSL
jgi:hypothetical protein